MQIKIGMAQIYPKLGDVTANLKKHLAFVDQAVEQGVELLVFPELSMTGYQLQDLVSEVAITAHADDPIFAELLTASKKLDMVVGFVQRDIRNRFFIASAYLSGGAFVHIHRKIYLPTYSMFDEARYFDMGEHVRAFDTRFGRVGMLICEDFWHMSPPYLLWMDGADILILQSASPSRGLDAGDSLSVARWVELVNQAYGSIFTNY
ncbi:MAG TPA: nitrilase-related carbon-nitrogen hydrolase, partial [Aggregatilineales bacterium]|nr:nitrilase-related carbon-nitrogen hydrolase [Aggregatilineales bacterium]